MAGDGEMAKEVELTPAEWIDHVADRFEAEWQAGRKPVIAEFLPSIGDERRAPLLVELVRIDVEFRKSSGESPSPEHYQDLFADGSHGEAATCEFADLAAQVFSPNPFPDSYRFRERLGAGSFGDVWLGEDVKLSRNVAIKTIRLDGEPTKRRRALGALRNEAQLAANLTHPNVVPVFAWLESDNCPYLVMRYVRGGSLEERVQTRGALDWEAATRFIADVGEALSHLHAHGIVHRDIKPANILWEESTNEAYLTDLGVSARLSEARGVAGSVSFMAPEVFDGRIGPENDVYSLAATLFCLITAVPPFAANTIEEIVAQARRGLPHPEPRLAKCPEPIELLIRAAMSTNPDQRMGLETLVGDLRSSLNKLLIDSLQSLGSKTGTADVDINLVVRRESGGDFQPVESTTLRPVVPTRDMTRVPATLPQLTLHTGDRVRIEFSASETGFVTVFNIGPTGNLNLLYPDDPQVASSDPLAAHCTLRVIDVEMTPPAGTERLCAVWSRRPIPLDLTQLSSLTGHADPSVSREYQATRDMQRVTRIQQQIRPDDFAVCALSVDHI